MQEMTIVQIKAINTSLTANEQFYVIDSGNQSHWYYDANDSTSPEDFGMVLVTTNGLRIKRVIDDFINLDWYDRVAGSPLSDYEKVSKALSYNMKVIVPNRKYYLDDEIDAGSYLNISSNGGEFVFSNSVSIGIKVEGSASGSYSITDPLERGSNYVVSAALAAAITTGDKDALVTISNDEIFNPYYPTIKKGELKQVFRVSGDKVYFTSPAYDDYAASSFVAKIITPCFVRIEGDFTVSIDQSNYVTSDVIGMQLYLANKPRISARFNYCTKAALRINTCFQAEVHAWVSNSTRTDNGYGIAIMNGTAESKFSGIFADCRHSITCVADTSGVGCLPHHNKIHDVVACGGRSNATIDAHGVAGLIEFSNILCTGGNIEDVTDTTVSPGGLNIGCREAIVKGFTGDMLGNVISIRSDAITNYLDVSDVTVLACSHLLQSTNESVFKNLLINGVSGSLTGVGLVLSDTADNMESLAISNVTLSACQGLITTSSDFLLPESVALHNVKIKNIKDENGDYKNQTGDTNYIGLAFGGTELKVLRLENCHFEGFYYGVKLNSDVNLDQLISLGSVYKDNREHILFDGNSAASEEDPIIRCYEFKSVGDHISGQSHGNTAYGFVDAQSQYNIVEYAQVDAFTCLDESYFFGRYAQVGTICLGVGKTSSQFVKMARLLDGFEVLSGTLTDPLISRGTGSPEGVITAKFSALYTKVDTPAAVYYKTTDTGNTGWQTL